MEDTEFWLREVRHTWPLINPDGGGLLASAVLTGDYTAGKIRLGRAPDGSRHLLVPTGVGQLAPDTSISSLEMSVRDLRFGGWTATYLDVSCRRQDLFDIFDEVLSDILSRLDRDDPAPALAAVQAVKRRRELFQERAPQALSHTSVMGLFAELLVFDAVVPWGQVDSTQWRGPLREPHDIVLPFCALEVKAVGINSTDIEIHGLEQLEPPERPLALVLVGVAESETGQTLGQLADRLLDGSLDRFHTLKLLAAAGYLPSEKDQYPQRFDAQYIDVVEVTPQVPCLVPASFSAGRAPEGITRVSYRIALSALTTHAQRGLGSLESWIAEVSS